MIPYLTRFERMDSWWAFKLTTQLSEKAPKAYELSCKQVSELVFRGEVEEEFCFIYMLVHYLSHPIFIQCCTNYCTNEHLYWFTYQLTLGGHCTKGGAEATCNLRDTTTTGHCTKGGVEATCNLRDTTTTGHCTKAEWKLHVTIAKLQLQVIVQRRSRSYM